MKSQLISGKFFTSKVCEKNPNRIGTATKIDKPTKICKCRLAKSRVSRLKKFKFVFAKRVFFFVKKLVRIFWVFQLLQSKKSVAAKKRKIYKLKIIQGESPKQRSNIYAKTGCREKLRQQTDKRNFVSSSPGCIGTRRSGGPKMLCFH